MIIEFDSEWSIDLSEVDKKLLKLNDTIDKLNKNLYSLTKFLSDNVDIDIYVKDILIADKRKLINILEYECKSLEKLKIIHNLLVDGYTITVQQFQEFILDYSTIEDLKSGKVVLD